MQIQNVGNLSFEEVCQHFANGAIHAKDVPEEGVENFDLYNTIRRLKSNKYKLAWHFCTRCGRVLYFNTRTHHNQLTRHFEKECVGQLIGDGKGIHISVCAEADSYCICNMYTFRISDKIYMTKKNFLQLESKLMEIGGKYGAVDISSIDIPKQWSAKNW